MGMIVCTDKLFMFYAIINSEVCVDSLTEWKFVENE